MRKTLALLCFFPLLCCARPNLEQQGQFQQAESLYLDGRFEEALGLWERLLDTDLERPERRVVRFNLARTLMELGRWDAAIPLLEAVAADREAGAELLRVVYSQIATAAIEEADKICPRDIDFEDPSFPEGCDEALTWLEHARTATDQAFVQHEQAALAAGRDAETRPRDLAQQRRAEQLRTAWIQAARQQHWRRHTPVTELALQLAGSLARTQEQLRSGERLDSVAVRARNNAADWVALRDRAPDDDLSQDLLFETLNSYQRALEYIDQESREGSAQQMGRSRYGLQTLVEAQKGQSAFGYLIGTRESLVSQGKDPAAVEELYSWLLSVRPDKEPLRQAAFNLIGEQLNDRAQARMHRLLFELLEQEETQTFLSLLERQDGDLLRALLEKLRLRAEIEGDEKAAVAKQLLEEGKLKEALIAWDLPAYLNYEIKALQRSQTKLAAASPLKKTELEQHVTRIEDLQALIRQLDTFPPGDLLAQQLQQAVIRNGQAQEAVQDQLVRHWPIYLRDALQWLKRAEHLLNQAPQNNPADVLRWALAEQAHALDLNAWTQELDPDEAPQRSVLEAVSKAQEYSIHASLPFLPSVQQQFPQQELQDISRQEPWDQVLVLFDEGSRAAFAASSLLRLDQISLQEALSEQVTAHDRWEEALRLLEPPDESQDPNEDDQDEQEQDQQQNTDQNEPPKEDEQDGQNSPPSTPEEPSRAQEILEMLQRMEEEDQHQQPQQGRVREGLKPW